jgi:hypothetical protein
LRARFFEEETTRASYEVLEGWVRKRGLLGSLDADRDSIYRCEGVASLAERLAGKPPQTQFGRAMKQLGAELERSVELGRRTCGAGDWTVAGGGRRYQLDQQHEALSLVRRKVIVRNLRNGRVQVVYRGKPLKWRALPAGTGRTLCKPGRRGG